MKTYTIKEISDITGLEVHAIRNFAVEEGLEKFGNGDTSPYICPESFLKKIQERIKNNPRCRPRPRNN